MRQHRPFVAHDNHGWEPVRQLERLSNTGSGFNRHHLFPFPTVKADIHGTTVNHHAYDRRAKAP
jgi:hypothetical protein